MNYRSVITGLIAACCWCSTGFAWQDNPTDTQTTQAPQATQNAGGQPLATTPQAQPRMPPGFPLDAKTQKYIEQLLAYWEGTSDQVTHYQCSFTRWQYDHAVCNFRKTVVNPTTGEPSEVLVAAEISRGSIRYRQPDKGMYEVNEKWSFAGPPDEPGGEPKYDRRKLTNDEFPEQEKWICDGQSIFEYDYGVSRLYEIKLPPESQGEGLKNSPLPFVFGAKAVELLDRYWIRDITRPGVQDQYWLEAWPKRLSDAQNYSKIEIILSRDPFLPMSIHMYAANYNEKTNPSKMVFEFEQREINGTLASLPIFKDYFIRPSTPFGWKRVERDLAAEGEAPRVGQSTGEDETAR